MKLFLFITLVSTVLAIYRIDPLVLTTHGLVRGKISDSGDYSIFLGIPYAQVDESNPFGNSLPAPTYSSVFNANDDSIKCPQSSTGEGVLDCLRLNVFVPHTASSSNLLPVMVWIHGGDFEEGSGPVNNINNIVTRDVILVTLNYRLGVYGFMCLDTPTTTGNQGLKDQLVALQWVKDNIKSFGGDSSKITIAGKEAGAVSVNYHMYSSQKKTFGKAIMQSYVAQTFNMYNNNDYDTAKMIASYLGYNASDTNSAISFLSATSFDLVVGASTALGLKYKPCKEISISGVDNMITTNPYSLSNPDKIRNTDVLIGAKKYEIDHNVNNNENFLVESFYNTLSKIFDFEDLQAISDLVSHYYIGDGSISTKADQVDKFKNDFFIHHPIEREIQRLLNQNAGNIYQYVFDDDLDNIISINNSEIDYLFSNNNEINDEEKLMAERIGVLWTNFIKYGKPTTETNDLIPVIWDPVTDQTRPYLKISKDPILQNRFNQESMSFWDLFFNNYANSNKLARSCYV